MVSPRQDKNWTLTTTSVTENQELGSYVVPKGKALSIEALLIEVSLTTLSTTEKVLGVLSVRWGGDVIISCRAVNPTSSSPFGFTIPLRAFEVNGDGVKKLDAVCSPSDTTSMKWRVNVVAVEGI